MDAGRSGYEVTVKNCGRVGSSRVKGQQWTIHGDGTLKLQRNSAMCLTKSGNSVGVARCSVSRRSDQKWKMMENKDETTLCLVLGNGACLNSALELIEAPVAVFGKKAAVPKDLVRFDQTTRQLWIHPLVGCMHVRSFGNRVFFVRARREGGRPTSTERRSHPNVHCM